MKSSVIIHVKIKKFKKSWKKHSHFVITGAQIITIVGIVAGVVTTYIQTHNNTSDIHKNTSDIRNVDEFVGNSRGTNFIKFRTDFTNLQNTVELQGEEIELLWDIITNVEVVPDSDPIPNQDFLPLNNI